METTELWDHSAKLISFVSDGDDIRTDINMPELTKKWDWRKKSDCYHMPTYSSEERLLESIGIKLDEENICVERKITPGAYRYGAVDGIYTVYFRTNYKKYKVAEYVKAAGRPLYYLTSLWRLSIGTNVYRPTWTSSLETKVYIQSTQLMDLTDMGYRRLFCSSKDCDNRDKVRKSRIPGRYDKGTRRFTRFLKYTRLAVVIMMYREEALSKCERGDVPQVDRELYKFWRKCRRFINGTLLSYL